MRNNHAKNANEMQSQNAPVALNLARSGWAVFPCDPATKAPMPGVKWKEAATSNLAKVAAWWQMWPDAMPALPTGARNGVSVVDLDRGKGKDGVAAYQALGLDPDAASVIVGTAGGGLHLYFDHRDGVRNSTNRSGVDLRGEGGYVIAPGAVGKAGSYTVQKGDPTVSRLLGFGDFPAALTRPASEAPDDAAAPGAYTAADLAEPLFRIPNDGSYDEWVRVLMAVHHATGGSKGGLALVEAWSAEYPGYDPKEVSAKWRSFGRSDGQQITVETLFAEARKHGWQSVTADDFDDDPEPSIEDLLDDDTPVKFGGLTFLTPDQCASLPARDYVAKRLIAPGQIGCVFGEPGAGKSLLAPRLAYAVAQGEEVFGLPTKPGAVFYVACEDEDGMAGRVSALRADLGPADAFHLVRGCSDLFSPGRIEGKGSPDLEALFRQVKTVKPKLVVIDTLAMAMPGLEENDAAGMNRVVQIGKRLAKYGAAVIFVHHGTKAEGNTPRGHSVFNGALDFSIMVKAADQNGVVRGVVRKNRNGPPDLDIAFKVATRRVGLDVDGEPVDAPICLPCDPGHDDGEPKLTKSEAAALALVLDMAETGPVDEQEWRGAAIDGMAVSGSDKRDSRQKAVARALSGLVQKGQLIVEDGLISIPYAVEDGEWDDDLEVLDHVDD